MNGESFLKVVPIFLHFILATSPQNFAETSKNVKNISKTLSQRQQMRAASVFYRGMFDTEDFVLPQQDVVYKRNLAGDNMLNKELENIMSDNDMLVTEVHVKGQVYKKGDLIVLIMKDCDTLDAGIIVTTLVKNNQIYFICKVYSCIRNWLQYFESQTTSQSYKYVNVKQLADFKPLVKKGSTDNFMFVLHHRISFAYK